MLYLLQIFNSKREREKEKGKKKRERVFDWWWVYMVLDSYILKPYIRLSPSTTVATYWSTNLFNFKTFTSKSTYLSRRHARYQQYVSGTNLMQPWAQVISHEAYAALELRTCNLRRSHDPRVIRLPWISLLLFSHPPWRKPFSREDFDTQPLTRSTRQRCRLLIFLLYRQLTQNLIEIEISCIDVQ